jgi:O-acetyl-ADP-ribose deacetylase (regulator of RNase III)
MIDVKRGNILDEKSEALVNTVNCMGYMGRGIALQFKKAFPENFKAYEKACRQDRVKPGKVFIFELNHHIMPKYIINFPTKRHYREKSRIQDIKEGLIDLTDQIKKLNIRSIAIPPLGCGLGGLDWRNVKPIIEEGLSDLRDIQILLFEPSGTPIKEEMPINTNKQELTPSRALLMKLMERYSVLDFDLTNLEIQKLAYFLQSAGQNLRLRFEKYHYGPYAYNLNKVLDKIEGQYIKVRGDNPSLPFEKIEPLPNAFKAVDTYLMNHKLSVEEEGRLESVYRLIDGFETPYGMELLASVHWVSVHDVNPENVSDVINAVHAWTPRKGKLYSARDIEIAWQRLQEDNWI